jgi:hypothetical protein
MARRKDESKDLTAKWNRIAGKQPESPGEEFDRNARDDEKDVADRWNELKRDYKENREDITKGHDLDRDGAGKHGPDVTEQFRENEPTVTNPDVKEERGIKRENPTLELKPPRPRR